MKAGDVSLLRNKGDGDFSWRTVRSGGWDWDPVDRRGLVLGILPLRKSCKLACVEVLPSFDDLGSYWLSENDRLSSTLRQLCEGCLVAVVALVLADNHNIRLGKVAQRRNTGLYLMLGDREHGVEDLGRSRKPWVEKDGEGL